MENFSTNENIKTDDNDINNFIGNKRNRREINRSRNIKSNNNSDESIKNEFSKDEIEIPPFQKNISKNQKNRNSGIKLRNKRRNKNSDVILNLKLFFENKLVVKLPEEIKNGNDEIFLNFLKSYLIKNPQDIFEITNETEFLINSLPIQKTCAICLEDEIKTEEKHYLKCGHIFHDKCIKQWILYNSICPQCKIELMDYDSHIIENGHNISSDDEMEFDIEDVDLYLERHFYSRQRELIQTRLYETFLCENIVGCLILYIVVLLLMKISAVLGYFPLSHI